ncbi:hypothetical protein TCAL_09358, partial [Tigriopus californicus]|eukprot:TCALIF_09358-PA protein Name:"Protein of unknown function" AED:0.30 eAED:0.30 QI:114/0.5/0.33/1/0.5/0.66/3/0/195
MKTLGFCILFFYLLRLGLTLKCNLTDDCQKCTQNPLCVFRIRDGIVQCTTKDEQLNVSHSLADETEIRSLSVKVVDEAMCSLTLEAFFQAIGNEGKSEQDPNDIETTWLGSVPEAVNVTDDFYQPDTSEGMYKALKDAETNFSTTPPRSLFPEGSQAADGRNVCASSLNDADGWCDLLEILEEPPPTQTSVHCTL